MKPSHVVATILVGAFVAASIGLGFWQLDRLGERRSFNERLLARGAEPVEPASILVAPGVDAERVTYRRATATGRYDVANEFLLLSRSHLGLSGHHVVTPLVLGDGRAILVDRGWVPLSMNEPPLVDAPPPQGEVSAEGILAPSQVRGRFGPRQTDGPAPTGVFRIDIPMLAERFPYDLLPVFFQLEEQEPPTAATYPIAVSIPPLDEGPHLSYAIQWFLFATAAIVTYVAVLRRRSPRGPGAHETAGHARAAALEGD